MPAICCIIPPHILHNIVKNAKSAALRRSTLQTLAKDSTFRSLRAARAATTLMAVPALTGTAPGKPSISVFDGKSTETLPGTAVANPARSADRAVKQAYAGLQATTRFYWSELERDSIDDHGMPLLATVHFGRQYDNAYWDGHGMVFGDGDGQLFNPFTASVDVIGHELTHGVTAAEADLHYLGQSGALNEHLSDVFGSLIKQKLEKQEAGKADWLIGKELLTASVQGVALRSMAEPGTAYDDPILGKDPQPGNMAGYVHTLDDNGGVHINSGIPNRAFCVAARAIGGYAWKKAGHIWYETVRDGTLTANAGFKAFARRTVLHAGRLFGAGGLEQKAVLEGWRQVGIRPSGVNMSA